MVGGRGLGLRLQDYTPCAVGRDVSDDAVVVEVTCDGGNADGASSMGDVVYIGMVMSPMLAELIEGCHR